MYTIIELTFCVSEERLAIHVYAASSKYACYEITF